MCGEDLQWNSRKRQLCVPCPPRPVPGSVAEAAANNSCAQQEQLCEMGFGRNVEYTGITKTGRVTKGKDLFLYA